MMCSAKVGRTGVNGVIISTVIPMLSDRPETAILDENGVHIVSVGECDHEAWVEEVKEAFRVGDREFTDEDGGFKLVPYKDMESYENDLGVK
jgi:hypothetical protein